MTAITVSATSKTANPLTSEVRTRTVPEEQRASVDHGGPHQWQTSLPARMIRRVWRHRAYGRHFDSALTELTINGLEHLQSIKGPAILAPNHSSHLDTIVLHEALPERIRKDLYYGAAADRWFRKDQKKLVLQPWYQSLILGTFPIVRGGGSKTLKYAKWLLGNGNFVCLFPEGTRAMGEDLGRFRHGISLLALELDVPIIPVYLGGLQKLRPKGAREVTPGPASIDFLPAVKFSSSTTVANATNILWTIMNHRHRQAVAPKAPQPAVDAQFDERHKAA